MSTTFAEMGEQLAAGVTQGIEARRADVEESAAKIAQRGRPLRWGLIARGEDRGLGHITWEAHRNLAPDRTLLIDLGELSGGFPMHPDRYGDNRWQIAWDGGPLDAVGEYAVRAFLDGLDVVYSAETFYDWRIIDWAREAGCATVLHAMPEFYRCGTDSIPVPDAVWAPTTWRLDTLPDAARLVPVPVALDRFPNAAGVAAGAPDAALRVLHVAGHRAAGDRNGTQVVLRSAAAITRRVHLTVTGQDGRLPTISTARRRGLVTAEAHPGGCPRYWDIYAGQDVLVMPRRYGGLCLPVQEGLAAGLVPILPDVSPSSDWPAVLVPARSNGTMAVPAGTLPLTQVRPHELARAIDSLAADRELLVEHRRRALEWAQAHSWEALGPLWLAELDRAR